MFSLTPNYFTEFFRQGHGKAEAALSDLVRVKNSLVNAKIPAIEKMYKYIDPLYARLEFNRTQENIFREAELATIGFLDAEVVKQFMQNPNDKMARDRVAEQIFSIAAANNCNAIVEPYTPSELALFLSGKLDYYVDDEMIATLRDALIGGAIDEILPFILTILAEDAANYAAIPVTFYTWNEALVFTLMLHLAWFYLPTLELRDQQILLNYYFYRAIVAGVPVRERLAELFRTTAGDGLADQKWFFSILIKSQELVAVKTDGGMVRPLGALWNEFASEYLDDNVLVLAEDEFSRKIYLGQDGREVYAPWVREALHCVRLLQKNQLK